jgi:hypothetical protein
MERRVPNVGEDMGGGGDWEEEAVRINAMEGVDLQDLL